MAIPNTFAYLHDHSICSVYNSSSLSLRNCPAGSFGPLIADGRLLTVINLYLPPTTRQLDPPWLLQQSVISQSLKVAFMGQR